MIGRLVTLASRSALAFSMVASILGDIKLGVFLLDTIVTPIWCKCNTNLMSILSVLILYAVTPGGNVLHSVEANPRPAPPYPHSLPTCPTKPHPRPSRGVRPSDMLYLCHRSQQTPPGPAHRLPFRASVQQMLFEQANSRCLIFASAVLAMLPLQRQSQQLVAIAPAELGDRPFVSLFRDYLLALIDF